MIAPHASVPGAPVVVKLGGRALEAPGAEEELALAVARLPAPAVLVHGGGAEVSRWCERLGIEPRFHDGLRVTDPAVLEVAVAVLAGLANKRLVAALRAAGVNAVGLAALDGGAATVVPHPDAGRLGAVGVVREAAAGVLRTLLAAAYVPVLASVGARDGRLLNVNADDLAAALAVSLSATDLLLLSDAPGLLLDGTLVPTLAGADVEAVLARPEVRGGMRPKLRAAAAGLAGGVRQVHIGAWQGPRTLARLLSGAHEGTTLFAGGPAAGSRPRAAPAALAKGS